MKVNHNGKKKTEPWRIAIGILAILYITYMWAKKDIIRTYAAMPKEQVLPLIVTTAAVSLAKVIAVAGGLILIRWIIAKVRNRKDSSSNRSVWG